MFNYFFEVFSVIDSSEFRLLFRFLCWINVRRVSVVRIAANGECGHLEEIIVPWAMPSTAFVFRYIDGARPFCPFVTIELNSFQTVR